MTGQMRTLFCILIAFFRVKDIYADKSSCSVYWTTSSPLILGQNVTLECTFIGEKCSGTYKWVGGPTNNVLALKNSVLDYVKYAIDITIERRYDLVIKNLSLRDLNVSYVCHCGFYVYDDVLRQSLITTNYPQDTTHYSVHEDKGIINITQSTARGKKDRTILLTVLTLIGLLSVIIIITCCVKRNSMNLRKVILRKKDGDVIPNAPCIENV